jgi:L-ascorbate metabolism protein UlaG (beta-lactamase superfamily)
MLLTWFGHGSFKLEYDDKVIYRDPYAGEPSWYDKPANLILISENAYDHWSRALVNKIAVDGTHIFGPAGVSSELFGCKTFEPGDMVNFEDGVRVQATQAVVSRGRGRSEGLGWLITIAKQTIYFTGDTDVAPNLKNARADVVVIPVGGTFTLNARDAAKVIEAIKPRVAIPAHYGSTSGTLDDAELFKELVEPSGTRVMILQQNKSVGL